MLGHRGWRWNLCTSSQTDGSILTVILHINGVPCCWDIQYTFGPDGKVCDDNKYMWPHPEAFAAALLLAKATGSEHYMEFYRTCWQYRYVLTNIR